MSENFQIKVSLKTILVIDDDYGMTDLLKHMLAKLGYKALSASNCVEGLKLLEKNKIDCVILDLSMPQVSGYQFLMAHKKLDSIKHVPVIVLSAKNRTDDVQKAMELGANAYMKKPIDEKILSFHMDKIVPNHYSANLTSEVSWI